MTCMQYGSSRGQWPAVVSAGVLHKEKEEGGFIMTSNRWLTVHVCILSTHS